MRSLFPCVGLFALAFPLAAQTGSVSRAVSISVTNVDVAVTDSSGKPITDLTAADFEIRQDGKVQPITNFSFVHNPLPAPSAGRRLSRRSCRSRRPCPQRPART